MGVPEWLVELKDWVQVLTPIMAALVVVFWNPIRHFCDNLFKKKIVEPEIKQNEQINSMSSKLDQISIEIEEARGIYKALLHHEIFITSKAAIERGYISAMELQNLDELYKAYRNLNGNGTARRLYHEAQELEMRE